MKFIVSDGIVPYSIALVNMDIAFDNVLRGGEECVFIAEHQGIYSAGKSFEHSDFIGQFDYPIYYTKRGGRVTVHNIGQIVIYPILNLKKRNLNVSAYVGILAQWMIDVLHQFDITATISDQGIGVWVNHSKIGFIGLRIEKGVSTHGFCLNVNNTLAPFAEIIPCGIKDISITSMEKILGHKIAMREVQIKFLNSFSKYFERLY